VSDARRPVTLVLLPGLDGTDIFFGPLLAHLPPWIEPMIVTYPPSGPHTYEGLLAVVEQKVAPLRDFAVLGWSFGGPLALMLAARRPEAVSGLMLCASFVTSPRPQLARLTFALSPPVIATVRAIRRMRFWIPGYADAAMREAKRRTWRNVRSRSLAPRARAALAVDARELLARMDAPILCLASSGDEVIPRSKLSELLAIAPRAKLAEMPGRHLALFTHPQHAAAHIARFLGALRGVTRGCA
jgi:pimeloyl-ACP methyl ester carboxylesterase